jgi:cytochrome c oxidase subunit II
VPGAPWIADTRSRFGDLFGVYEWLMVAVAAIVFTLVLFALVRYRRRGDELPRGRDEHKVAESIYAAVLAAIAVTLVTLTFRTEDHIDPVASKGGIRVNIVAFEWQWRFDYPDLGKTVIGTDERPAELVVPVRTLIRFDGTSRDVIHAFWVPEQRYKHDEFPKRHTKFDLSFDRVGTFIGRCAEFCGLRHTDMGFTVRVVPQDEFRRWAGRA